MSRWARPAVAVVAVALLAVLVAANRSELPAMARALRHADPAWLLAGAGWLLVWWAAWLLLHVTSRRATGVGAGPEWRAVLPVTVGSIAVNLTVKSGGLAGIALFDGDGRSRGLPRGPVRAGYLLAATFAEVAFLVTLALAVVMAWWDGELTRAEAVAVAVFLVFLCLRGVALVAAVRSRTALRTVWTAPARAWDRLRRRPPRRHDTTGADELYDAVAMVRSRPGTALTPLAAAVAIDLVGVGMLWSAIGAVGGGSRPMTALVAYAISVLFGIVGVLPGGLGFAEVGVVAVLVSSGLPAGPAAAAAVVFRVWEFWLPLAVGAAAAWRVRRSPAPDPDPVA